MLDFSKICYRNLPYWNRSSFFEMAKEREISRKVSDFLFTLGHFWFHFWERHVIRLCERWRRNQRTENKSPNCHSPSIIDTSLFACLTMCKTSDDYSKSIPSAGWYYFVCTWAYLVSSDALMLFYLISSGRIFL